MQADNVLRQGLFLEILGIHFVGSTSVQINHLNPFPWDVKVSYRGTSILCSQQAVTIKFSNGETLTIDDQIPCLVENNLIQPEVEP